jgi:hypothetical protein
MSDKRALLWLFDGILSHLAPALLDIPRRRPLPLVAGWGKLDEREDQARGWKMGSVAARTYVSADNRE